jgi:hypothetical protein
MAAPDGLRHLAPDDLHVPQLVALQAAARHRPALQDVVVLVEVPAEARILHVAGARGLLFGRLRVRKVDEPVAGEVSRDARPFG